MCCALFITNKLVYSNQIEALTCLTTMLSYNRIVVYNLSIPIECAEENLLLDQG